ncbi:hypothetical protein [Endozoicomonas sp.]|nr:hypothetical protein [Endozoicomonas sp.]
MQQLPLPGGFFNMRCILIDNESLAQPITLCIVTNADDYIINDN